MHSEIAMELKRMRWGISLALCAFLFGFGLGGLFGAAEDAIKSSLSKSADQALETVYKGDAAAAKQVVSKSWSYFKRAHLHAGGLGAASMAMILLLALVRTPGAAPVVASSLLGIGSIAYPLFWMLAGWRAPCLGGTHAAKESLALLAIPAAGCVLVGTFITAFHFMRFAFGREK